MPYRVSSPYLQTGIFIHTNDENHISLETISTFSFHSGCINSLSRSDIKSSQICDDFDTKASYLR